MIDRDITMNSYWTKFLPSFIGTKLEGRKILQRSIENTGWLFADNILRMCAGMFVGVWTARYLGPEQFGILTYAIAFIALFSPLATLGLDSIVVREILLNPRDTKAIMDNAFLLKLVGGMLAVVLTIGTIKFVRPNDSRMHWIAGIIAAGMIFQAFDTIDFWFQSQLQSKYTVYAKSAAFILANIGKVCLIIIHAPLIAFAWIALIEIVIGAAGIVTFYRLNGHMLWKWQGSLSRAKELLRNSWPLIFSGIVIMMYMKIDQIMLGEMIGDEAVGIYSSAVRLSEAWYFIPTAIVVSVFPGIIEAKRVSESLYHEHLQKLYNIMTWIAISIAVPTTFFSNQIIDLLFGAKYYSAGTVLSIHIWSGIFVFLGVASYNYLLAENYTLISFFRTFLGAVVNIILNLVLIPLYGVNGAAIATLIAYFIATFSIVFIKKTRGQSLLMFKSLLMLPAFKKYIYD